MIHSTEKSMKDLGVSAEPAVTRNSDMRVSSSALASASWRECTSTRRSSPARRRRLAEVRLSRPAAQNAAALQSSRFRSFSGEKTYSTQPSALDGLPGRIQAR